MKITKKTHFPWVILLALPMFTFLVQAYAQPTNQIGIDLKGPIDTCKRSSNLFNFYITDMGNIGSYQTPYVRDINNKGESYGELMSNTSTNQMLGFKHVGREFGVGMTLLNINAEFLQIESANDNGEIVGSRGSIPTSNNNYSPFYYDGSTTTTLVTPLTNATYVLPTSINNKGEIVGSAYDTDKVSLVYWPNKNSLATVFSSMGFGVGINNVGKILFNNNNAVFVARPGQKAQKLPHLSSANFSQGTAINNNGIVLGTSQKLNPPRTRPVFWSPTIVASPFSPSSVSGYGPAQEIAILPDANGNTIDINNNNYALVKFNNSNYLVNLTTKESYALPNPPNSFSFRPVGINDNCEIVGDGYTSGGVRAYKYIPL